MRLATAPGWAYRRHANQDVGESAMLEELNRGDVSVGAPTDLKPFWPPFPPNRQFKQHPRLVVSAKGLYYKSHDGRDILDSSAGLWCANLGHCHPKVVEAGQRGVWTPPLPPAFPFR